MSDPRVLVLLPAWNEEEALPALLTELAAYHPVDQTVVVDDGSTDKTSAVARAAGVQVLTLPINLGVGGAVRAGYRWALRNGFDYVVQLDADGQHDPRDIERVLAPVLSGHADLCIGARFAGAGDYKQRGPRGLAMRLLARWVSAITGSSKLTDTTSGFKAANNRAVAVFGQDFPMEYLGDTVEALIIGHKAGLRITQVPVAMRSRQGGVPSHQAWRSAVFLIRAVMAVLIAITRPATKAEAA